MKTLKVKNYKNVMKEKTIDVFKTRSFDDVCFKLEIKDTGNCIISTCFQVLGWTEDVNFAFNVFKNSIPISDLNEIMEKRC